MEGRGRAARRERGGSYPLGDAHASGDAMPKSRSALWHARSIQILLRQKASAHPTLTAASCAPIPQPHPCHGEHEHDPEDPEERRQLSALHWRLESGASVTLRGIPTR